MKKKIAAIISTGLLIASPLAFAASNTDEASSFTSFSASDIVFADRDSHGHGDSEQEGWQGSSSEDVLQLLQQTEDNWQHEHHGDDGEHGDHGSSVNGDDNGDGEHTVADDTYDSDHKGLQNALNHVKNEHARMVLEAILNGISPSLINKLNVLGDNYGVSGDAYGTLDGTTVSTDNTSVDPQVYDIAKQLLTILHQDQSEQKSDKAQTLAKLLVVFDTYGDANSAIQAGEDQVSTDPTQLDAFQQLGKLYQKRGDITVKAFVNGVQPNFDVKPYLSNNRTMVPVAAIAKALGANVQWDDKTSTVTFKKGNDTVVLQIGSKIATVNGKQVTLDAPADLVGDRTVVPVHFVSDALHATVQWVPDGNIVDITTSDGSNQ